MTDFDPELDAAARCLLRHVAGDLSEWAQYGFSAVRFLDRLTGREKGDCVLTLLLTAVPPGCEAVFNRAVALLAAQVRYAYPECGRGGTDTLVVSVWNDAPERTRDEVRELLERAGGVK